MEKNIHNKTIERSPIVVVLGHVDHGKSTLLDYIRNTNTVAEETGGITQHVAAYEVSVENDKGKEREITFLDTPGHEAFEAMRDRSTRIADIAILIVSAEEAVQAQTKEALAIIKKQQIPYVVAINKIDKPNANVQKTITSLVENEVYCEGHGGDIPCAQISSKTGEGINTLLELVLLVADLEELTGNPHKDAEGFVIESQRNAQKGITATLIIKDGTLTHGMFIAAGTSIAPTRTIEDFAGTPVDTATFSSPVRIAGWNTPPTVGASFASFQNKKEAENFVAQNQKKESKSKPSPKNKEIPEGEEKEVIYIPLIIKTDVIGSIDAITHEIDKITDDSIHLKILRADVGNISENDVKTAGGDNKTLIVGFNTKVDTGIQDIAERIGITVATFTIIYKLTEWLENEIEKRKPKESEKATSGTVKILKIFSETKKNRVVGGSVETGVVAVGNHVAILRRDEHIGEGTIKELQLMKQSATLVKEKNECGIKIETTTTIVPNDSLEVIHT